MKAVSIFLGKACKGKGKKSEVECFKLVFLIEKKNDCLLIKFEY